MGYISQTNLEKIRKRTMEEKQVPSTSKSGSFRKGAMPTGVAGSLQKCRLRGTSLRKLPRLTKVFEFEKSFLVPPSVQVKE